MTPEEVMLLLSSVALLAGSILSRQGANAMWKAAQSHREAMRYYEEVLAHLKVMREGKGTSIGASSVFRVYNTSTGGGKDQ